MNTLKTFLLLTALTLLFIWVGGLLGGHQGMMFALVLACVMNLTSYWFSDKIVLALYRARPASESEAPEIYSIVRELTTKARLPMPKVYLIPTQAPNAFATGRDPKHAVVAVTEGILELLDRDELAGVLGHELMHVEHRDILISSVAATVAGAISMLADMARWTLMLGGARDRDDERQGHPIAFLIALFLVPIAAMLIQLAISRSREFAADEGGAILEGHPKHLAHALEKLEQANKIKSFPVHPSTAHLFIVNPLSANFLMKLFSTHPPTQERIERLEKLAQMNDG